MPGAALALVLAAAVIHAGWNALAKRAAHPLCFLWCSVSIATLGFLPYAAWRLGADGLPAAALPFVLATSALHGAYFYALGRALGAGDLSVVYPVARGLGVALVPALALPLLGERLSPLGVAGVALVVAGIGLTQLGRGARPWRTPAAGLGWAVLTGLTIAAYSLVDRVGVQLLHPVPYLVLMGLGMSLLVFPAVRRSGALGREWRLNRSSILLASTLNLTSYLLVLFAFRLAKTGYVVAARETSIVVSVLIGGWWLGEAAMARRLAGAAVVLAGVAAIALAR